MDSLRSKLLVAGPTLLDPNFRRTVVLICEHTPEGAGARGSSGILPRWRESVPSRVLQATVAGQSSVTLLRRYRCKRP